MRPWIRTSVAACLAIALPACASDGEPPRHDSKAPEYASGIVIVPIAATDDDVELVETAIGRMAPHADITRAPELGAPVVGRQVDGRAVVEELGREYPAASGAPVMVLGVTSEDLQDLRHDVHFVFLVRDRPHAVLSTYRLRPAAPGVVEDRTAKLVARLLGTVYFRFDEAALMRSGLDLGPFGRLDSLDDLDAASVDICPAAELLYDGEPEWNTREEYRRQLGCPVPDRVLQPYEYPARVADVFDACEADHGGARCYTLGHLLRIDPRIGRYVDRATGLHGAACIASCVFAVQRVAGDRGVVIRSYQRDAGLAALHTHWPEQGGSFVDTCMPTAGPVCAAGEPVCPDPALVAWVRSDADWRQRGPIPASATRAADC